MSEMLVGDSSLEDALRLIDAWLVDTNEPYVMPPVVRTSVPRTSSHFSCGLH